MQVWLGIDAGGSRSVLLAVDKDFNIVFKDQGSSIHARMMKVEDQVAGVTRLIDNFSFQYPNTQILGFCIGIAGGGREAEQKALRNALEVVYPKFPIKVTSDAHVAHAEAFKNGDGILIITGTGSMVLGRKDEKWDRAGGYGFLIGDPAGGYRLGQESLFAICTALDGGASTVMSDLIKNQFNINTREELISNVYDNTVLPAQIAPILLEAAQEGDLIAQEIVKDNCKKLANQVAIASKALKYQVTPICVIGGLFNNSYFRNTLKEYLNEAVKKVKWADGIEEPAMGACRLAMS
jgi:glucosamine kinase